MKKKSFSVLAVSLIPVVLLGAVIAARFSSKSLSTDYTKKVIFDFDFTSSFISAELGPGDIVTIRPYVTSESSVPICVFIKVDMPYVDGGPLYDMNISSDWSLVEQSAGYLAYAYVDGGEIYNLSPEESTNPLATTMKMKSISVSEFALIESINCTFTAYTMEITENTPSNPSDAWLFLKEIASLQ